MQHKDFKLDRQFLNILPLIHDGEQSQIAFVDLSRKHMLASWKAPDPLGFRINKTVQGRIVNLCQRHKLHGCKITLKIQDYTKPMKETLNPEG